MRLGASDRDGLLRLARRSIRSAVQGEPDPVVEPADLDSALHARCGVFVTLEELGPGEGPRDRRLRGCVGDLAPDMPLYRSVQVLAPKAALDDPRFPPLGVAELERVRISISILTPLRRLEDPASLVLGSDGVQLTRGHHRAVFLPQVAEQQGWDVEQMLDRLSLKAGLEAGAWRDAELRVFRTETIAERR